MTTQNIVSHGSAEVRLLWFGIVIQFILLVEIFEVVISGNVLAYAIQISIFAGLATVFAVLGVDQHIYAPENAQKGTGAGWLITAIIDLLWIIYFTSHPIHTLSDLPAPWHQLGRSRDMPVVRTQLKRSQEVKMLLSCPLQMVLVVLDLAQRPSKGSVWTRMRLPPWQQWILID